MSKRNHIGASQSAWDNPDESPNEPSIMGDFIPATLQTAGWKSGKKSEEIEQLKRELQAARDEIESQQEQLTFHEMVTEKAIIPLQNGSRALGRFRLSLVGIEAPDSPTQDELQLLTGFIRDVSSAYQFWGGDLANLWKDHFGVLSKELAEHFGIEPTTLQNWAYVCEKISLPLRHGDLTFSHHQTVAYMDEKLSHRILEILDYASAHALSVRDLRAYLPTLLPAPKRTSLPQSDLFAKKNAPSVLKLKKLFTSSRAGDEAAKKALKRDIETYRTWLKTIAKDAGIE